MSVDTILYKAKYINAVKNLNFPAWGNQLPENKVGLYRDLQTEFLIKFTNFNILTALPDTLRPEINSAQILLHISDYFGTENNFSLDLYLIDADTALQWDNNSKISEVKTGVEGRFAYHSNFQFSSREDSLFIPVDLDLVQDWYRRPNPTYQNNGFLIRKANDAEGLVSFYSQDNSLSKKHPKLRLQCSLRDSNNVFIKDSTFYIPAAGDLQFSENHSNLPDSLFYLSQGNIFRAYIMLDSLRTDSLLGRDRLLNKAQQFFVMDAAETEINPGDSLYLTARLFRTDSWENDSIAYSYMSYSNVFTSPTDTIGIDISQLLQYLVSHAPDKNYEGIFYYLNNEYDAFNKILIRPALSGMEVIYTRLVNE